MKFEALALEGCFLIELRSFEDERGRYTKLFDNQRFAEQGLAEQWRQLSRAVSAKKGTMRGLHWQAAPHSEAKLVQCTRGKVFDVAVDMREGSGTFGKWVGQVLDADDALAFYVPEGFAHGFVSLEDDSEILYSSSNGYHPESERGLRYDDPALGIEWPVEVSVISEKDRQWPWLEVRAER